MKRILVMGHRYFVDMIVPELNKHERYLFIIDNDWKRNLNSLIRFLKVDAIYFIGGSVRSSNLHPLTKLLDKPIIMHWVGTDVLEAKEYSSKCNLSSYVTNQITHWAISSWIKQELREVNIYGEEIPLTSLKFPGQPLELPENFSVLAYIPEHRHKFYGSEIVVLLAHQFPEIRFRILASTLNSEWIRTVKLSPNIELLGHVADIREVYKDTSVLLRPTQHDGLSFMVLEALAYGRHVIWSQSIGPVDKSDGYEAIHRELSCLFVKHANKQLEMNLTGSDWVRKEYNSRVVEERLLLAFSDVLGV